MAAKPTWYLSQVVEVGRFQFVPEHFVGVPLLRRLKISIQTEGGVSLAGVWILADMRDRNSLNFWLKEARMCWSFFFRLILLSNQVELYSNQTEDRYWWAN